MDLDSLQGIDRAQFNAQALFLGSFRDAGNPASLERHSLRSTDESVEIAEGQRGYSGGTSGGESSGRNCKKTAKARGNERGGQLGPAQTKNSAAQKRYRERQKDKMEVFKQQVETLSRQLEALQTENENLEERNRLLEKVVQLKEQKGVPDKEDKTSETNNRQLFNSQNTYLVAADYLNTVRRHEKAISVEEAANITPEDLRQIRLDYVKELAKLLLKVGDGEDDKEGMRELEDYVLSVRLATINLVQSMTVRSFAQVLSLKKRILNASFVSERIMLAMNLTWDQKRDYIRARRALIARNEEIRRKRRELVVQIEAAVPGAAPLMCSQKATLLNACESSDQFKASLEDEHRSTGQFHIDCVQVLTPLQEARALIEAHPGAPDHWLISGYLEAEQEGKLEAWLGTHLSHSDRQALGNNAVQSLTNPQRKNSFVVACNFESDSYADSDPASRDPQQKQAGEPAGLGPQWQPLGARDASWGSEQNSWVPEAGGLGSEAQPSKSGSDSAHRYGSDQSCQAGLQSADAAASGGGKGYWDAQGVHYGGGYLPVGSDGVAGEGPVVSLTEPETDLPMQTSLPMQTTTQGLQTVADMPTLEMMDGLTDFQEDDMWLDLFPGLITQS